MDSDRTQAWRNLYRQAINEANGLTNYVEDRPELRCAEKKLEALEAMARALDDAPIEAAVRAQPLTGWDEANGYLP